MNAPLAHPLDVADIEREPEPIKIDPRPCQSCGGTIDQHERVDTPEGPEFFCDDIDREIFLRTAALVKRWEIDDARDRWRHTGESPPPWHVRNSDMSAGPYRPNKSTVLEFWHIATHEPAKLRAWLARHHADAPALRQIWKAKQ